MIRVAHAISRWKYDLQSEKVTQAQIRRALEHADIEFEQESAIGPRDIVDFLCEDGVAVEVKLKGQMRAIHRQLVRYCESDRVEALILATARAMVLPKEINGKPCMVLHLGGAWL